MAKPYRRRKGKRGPYVGNFRVTIDGRDINLLTKDASEAHHRARLAAKGQWPPEEAAARAAATVLDPAGDAPTVIDDVVPPPPNETPKRAPEAPPLGSDGASPDDEPEDVGDREPLDDAAAAAAAAAAGAQAGADDDAAGAAASIDDELRAVMAELSGGAAGGDLLDQVCDAGAAGLLWFEGICLKYGIKWTLKKNIRPGQPEPTAFSRKCLRVGLKGVAVTKFPELASKLTPGWAILVGLALGAKDVAAGAELIEEDGSVTPIAGASAQPAAPADA